MSRFFEDMQVNPLLANGLLAGLLAALACGLVGPYVIARRIVFLAGAIAHMAVGGIGAAIFLNYQYPEVFGWMRPLHGAVLTALAAAVVIGFIHDRVSERLDTLIGAMWAVGMAVGILLIKFTPGYHAELMSYLFGNLAFVSGDSVWLMAALNLALVAAVLLTHKRLLAICIDEQQARLQGVSVLWTHILLLAMVALTTICLIQVVGLILVLALLTLPAATAAHFVSRIAPMIVFSVLLAAALTTLPRIGVYGTRLSPESSIVVAAASVYLLAVAGFRVASRIRRGVRIRDPQPV